MTREEPPHRADPDRRTTFGELLLDLGQRNIALLLDKREDEAGLRLDPARKAVAALPLCYRPAVAKCQLPPADRRRDTDPETRRRPTTAQPALNRRYDPVPQIL